MNMKFLLDNEVVHCETKRHCRKLFSICRELNLAFVDGDKYTKGTKRFMCYKTNTCYDLNFGLVGNYSFYKKEGYVIVGWHEFNNRYREFKKGNYEKAKNIHIG